MINRLIRPVSDVADTGISGNKIDQRVDDRTRTVCRTVKVESSQDKGLARLQNISDGGMMLHLRLPILLGDTVTVFLSDDTSVSARVIWTEAETCGVQFTRVIDSAAVLAELAQRTRSGSVRPIRLQTDVGGVVYSERGIHSVRVVNVSQRGMQLEHQHGLVEGVAIKVLLSSGIERRGVVRWSNGTMAGIRFLEAVDLDQLGSAMSL